MEEEMGFSITQSLTFTTLPKPSANPTLDRRTKIIARFEEQKLLLADSNYARAVRTWVKKDGEKTVVDKRQRVLPWWSLAPNVSYVFFVRSDWKPVEFEKAREQSRCRHSTSCRRLSTP
jgi:hypothetical protein